MKTIFKCSTAPRLIALGALVLGLAGQARAQSGPQSTDLTSLLNTMKTETGPAYLAARDALIKQGPSLAPALRTRVAAAQWTASSWRDDWAASVALTWIEDGARCLKAYKLQGLESGVYNQRRNGKPSIHRELAALDVKALAPVLVEILTKTAAIYPLSSAAEQPKTAEALAAQEQRVAAERLALREGCLFGLGRSGHPAAGYVLAERLVDASASLPLRRTAALSLGEARGAIASEALAAAARDGRADVSLRAAALAGLAKLRDESPLPVLRELIASGPLALRQAAIQSLGNYASSWSWYGQPAELAGRVRGQAARLVAGLVEDKDFDELAPSIKSSLKLIDHPEALGALDDVQVKAGKSDDGRPVKVDAKLQGRIDALRPLIKARPKTGEAPK